MARSLKVAVSSDCIGSGTCRRLMPTMFGADAQRKSVVLANPVGEDETLWEVLDSCPVEAISATDAETGEDVFP